MLSIRSALGQTKRSLGFVPVAVERHLVPDSAEGSQHALQNG